MRAKLEYLRNMARELALLAESDGLVVLGYLFRMAEAEAGGSKLTARRGKKEPARLSGHPPQSTAGPHQARRDEP